MMLNDVKINEKLIDHENSSSATSQSQKRESMRSLQKIYTYESSWKEENLRTRIICNEVKKKKGRLLPLTAITLTKTLEEFADLHIKNKNIKYLDGADRIKLTLATKSLLVADAAYHPACYSGFCSDVWKKPREDKTN